MSVLGCDVPVMQAPLGRGAAARLAIAVSQAGGLGTPRCIVDRAGGAARADPLDRAHDGRPVLREPRARLRAGQAPRGRDRGTRSRGCRSPSGMRPLAPSREHTPAACEAMVQVASADLAASAARDAGADVLIVQGVEAGGHVQSVVGLLPLLAEVSRAVSLPLLAAGGIADPVSARAALAAGADAGGHGHAIRGQRECDAHPRYKARLLEAEGRETVLTRTLRCRLGRPALSAAQQHLRALGGRRPARSRPTSERRRGDRSRASSATRSTCRCRHTKGDVEAMAMYAGQGVGAIDTVELAAAIIERFAATLRPA